MKKNGTVQCECTDSDDRVEWYTETWVCPKCHTVHERLTTYQPQSRLVAKDEFYIVNKGKRG
jgi:Zn finger protein HypA/HybF involved in hydrogenase expression